MKKFFNMPNVSFKRLFFLCQCRVYEISAQPIISSGQRDEKVVLVGSPCCLACFVNSSYEAQYDPAAERPHKNQNSTVKIRNKPNCCFAETEATGTVSNSRC